MRLRIRAIDHVVLRVRNKRRMASMVGEIGNRFGAEGNGISIYLHDPEGNTIELKGPSDAKGPPPSPRA